MPLFKYGAATPAGEVLINGSAVFPLLQVLGISITSIDGDVSLPVLSVYGLSATDGTVTIPVVRIYGKMQDTINGTVSFPLVGVSSEIFVSSAIFGNIALRRLSVSGNMETECYIDLPMLRVFGVLQTQGVIIGKISIRRHLVFGEVEQTQYLNCNIALHEISVSGVVRPSQERTVAGAVTIPDLCVYGIIFNSTYSFSEDESFLRYDSSRRLI